MKPCDLIRGKRYWIASHSRYAYYYGAGSRFGEDVYMFRDICDAWIELSTASVARVVIEK